MKKIIISILLMGIAVISGCVTYTERETSEPDCFAHFLVSCINDAGDASDIECSADTDCTKEKMTEYCQPNRASLAICENTIYYCNNAGLCSGCNCVT